MPPTRFSRKQIAFLVVVPAFVAVLLALACGGLPPPPAPPPDVNAGGDYFFCFWNVENLFDDRNDELKGADKVYDEMFANEETRNLKLDHLSEVILKMNDGKGPDILALAEVESERAAELLKDRLNKNLKDTSLKYTEVVFKEIKSGRHIAPAIITRLKVDQPRTHQIDKIHRILEAHISVNNHDLVVLASHWTSRVTDEEGSRRDVYADKLYGRYRAIYTQNPKVDLVICGDFNDPPNDESVTEHLNAIGDRNRVLQETTKPLLLNLVANHKPKDDEPRGTMYHAKEWFIFDQIIVSPGMLDEEGWSCDPKTARIQKTPGKKEPPVPDEPPWSFGGPKYGGKRGYSDHFPVSVRLQVHP